MPEGLEPTLTFDEDLLRMLLHTPISPPQPQPPPPPPPPPFAMMLPTLPAHTFLFGMGGGPAPQPAPQRLSPFFDVLDIADEAPGPRALHSPALAPGGGGGGGASASSGREWFTSLPLDLPFTFAPPPPPPDSVLGDDPDAHLRRDRRFRPGIRLRPAASEQLMAQQRRLMVRLAADAAMLGGPMMGGLTGPGGPATVKGTCGICDEEPDWGLSVVGLNSGGEHFKKNPCGHAFCQHCLAQWIHSQVHRHNK